MLYLPAAQAAHAVEVDAAATTEYLPTAQLVQTEVPVATLLYEPATQAVHTADVLAVTMLP